MTSHTNSRKVFYSSAAMILSMASAFAQEPPPIAPGDTSGASAIVVPDDIPWHEFQVIERRYKIDALRFKARDESGYDWLGSDEVMVETTDAKGWTVTAEIGDIDSGDVHAFDARVSCIVAVQPGSVVLGETSGCDDVGEVAPLSFLVEMWEKDFSIFGLPTKCLPGGPGTHSGPHCGNDGMGDDFLGRARVDLLPQELEAAMPNVGDQHLETVVLSACSSGTVCDVTFGPDYSFTFNVTRLADVQTGMRGILDEAMRRIGARTELEAIVAGLRALREPAPRATEQETEPPLP